jgi:hypothetical protein
MTEPGPVLHVRYGKLKLGQTVWWTVFLVVVLALTVVSGLPWRFDALHWAIGALVAADLVFVGILGVATARAAVRAVTGRPLLSLDAGGVTLHSIRLRVAWPNVAQIRLVPAAARSRAMMLVFVPHDPARITEGRGPWARWFARSYTRRLGSPIVAPVSGLAVAVDEVLRVAGCYTDAPVRRQYPVGVAAPPDLRPGR